MYLGVHKIQYRLSEGGESDTEFKIKSNPPDRGARFSDTVIRNLDKVSLFYTRNLRDEI